jgi:prepilin-type N-terminal cleavage/methylation domain-containing protein
MNIKYNSPSSARAFSLIELLTVIAVIAVIAAILLPVGAFVARKSRIQEAQTEEKALETAIDNYHAKYGFYPPTNTNATPGSLTAALTNQLYYELIGTTATNNGSSITFITLDQKSSITASTVQEYFGVQGLMNCTKGSGEDAVPAQTFLSGLKSAQIATNNDAVCVIVTAASSDPIYRPMLGYNSLAGYVANPWRYLYPGVNNPNSYDLWVELYVGGKTNLICNWKDTPQINSSMP